MANSFDTASDTIMLILLYEKSCELGCSPLSSVEEGQILQALLHYADPTQMHANKLFRRFVITILNGE